MAGPALPALVGPEAVRALKGQLERLTTAKATIAGDAMLGHVAAGLEQQIQGIRNQLVAVQPLEVALRGTLGAVASARQALTRAEQKAAKLEAQVVAALAAYDGAAAEVQSCQKALADAEAATARTAGGRFDPRLLIGGHPGAALAILSEAAAARCVIGTAGVDASLAARVQAAFNEVQNVCRLLPAEVPAPPPPSPPAGMAGGGISAAAHAAGAPPEVPMGEAASGGAGQPRGSTPLVAPNAAADPTHGNQDLTDQQLQFQQQAEAQKQAQAQQLLAQQQAAHQQAQLQAAELARQHAQAALEAAAVAASAATDSQLDSQAAEPAKQPEVGANGEAATGAHDGSGAMAAHVDGGVTSDPVAKPARDDCMGGGAADGVANKRNAAAIESARAVAAKAKARAS